MPRHSMPVGVYEARLTEISGIQLPLIYRIPEHIKLAEFIAFTLDIVKTGMTAGSLRLSVLNRIGQVRVAVPDATVIPITLTTRVSFNTQGSSNLLVVDNIHSTSFPPIKLIEGDQLRLDMTNGEATDVLGPTLITLETLFQTGDEPDQRTYPLLP